MRSRRCWMEKTIALSCRSGFMPCGCHGRDRAHGALLQEDGVDDGTRTLLKNCELCQ